MKAKLQRYLQEAFGIRLSDARNSISYAYSIRGQVYIRFEPGGELPNGTKTRVEQATQRAVKLFEETFKNREEEIWLLVYKNLGESVFGKDTKFLKRQFSVAAYAGFYKEQKLVCISGEELLKIRMIIGRVKVRDLKYANILNAIANTEMGFEPNLNEKIFFIGTKTNNIFYMYDDRGCFVESNKIDNIRELYLKRKDWIVNYHQAEIDKQFQ